MRELIKRFLINVSATRIIEYALIIALIVVIATLLFDVLPRWR